MTERLRLHPRYQQAIEAAELSELEEAVFVRFMAGGRHVGMVQIGREFGMAASEARDVFDRAHDKLKPHLPSDTQTTLTTQIEPQGGNRG